MATCKHGHTVGPEVGCVLCDLDASRARIAELEGALRDVLRRHDGMHTDDCNAYGADDEDVQGDPHSPDPYCECGATKVRDQAHALLTPSSTGERRE